jgi:hypothetical protein
MPESLAAEIARIYRYPVKGLSPERLSRVVLAAGRTLPGRPPLRDRKRPQRLDPADPKWMSKAYFLMLMRDEWLAGLDTHFDDASHTLTIRGDCGVYAEVVAGGTVAEGDAIRSEQPTLL